MAASFPGTTVTEPTAEIASNLVIKSAHMDQLYLEVVAIENSILGSLGASRSFKPASSSGVPLTLRGVTSQSADLLDVGSSASATDRLVLTAAGQLQLPVSGSTGGLTLAGTMAAFSGASGSITFKGSALSTSGFIIQDTTPVNVFQMDTTNKRLGLGTASSNPSTTLHLNPGAAPTTAPFGIQFGSDTAANLYRVNTGSLRSDATEIGVGTTGGRVLFVTGGSTNPFVSGSTANLSTGYTGTDYVTASAKYLEVFTSTGSSPTGIILKRPDGSRRLLTINNSDEITITTTGF